MIVAGPLHAAAMAAVHETAFPAASRWSAAAIATMLATPGTLGLLHSAGGMAMGRTAAGETEILTLAVTPQARRRGVARAMLTRLLVDAQAAFLEVETSNAAARALYASAGFTDIGWRRGYYGPGRNAVVLRWRGSAPSEHALQLGAGQP